MYFHLDIMLCNHTHSKTDECPNTYWKLNSFLFSSVAILVFLELDTDVSKGSESSQLSESLTCPQRLRPLFIPIMLFSFPTGLFKYRHTVKIEFVSMGGWLGEIP